MMFACDLLCFNNGMSYEKKDINLLWNYLELFGDFLTYDQNEMISIKIKSDFEV